MKFLIVELTKPNQFKIIQSIQKTFYGYNKKCDCAVPFFGLSSKLKQKSAGNILSHDLAPRHESKWKNQQCGCNKDNHLIILLRSPWCSRKRSEALRVYVKRHYFSQAQNRAGCSFAVIKKGALWAKGRPQRRQRAYLERPTTGAFERPSERAGGKLRGWINHQLSNRKGDALPLRRCGCWTKKWLASGSEFESHWVYTNKYFCQKR